MQINNMIPVLLEILTGQAGQNRVKKTDPGQGAPGQEAGSARLTAGMPAGKTSPAAEKGIAGDTENQVRQTTAGSGLPDFLPLPLKSPLFTESRFYIKNQREDSRSAGKDGATGVFIRLRTANLGVIWISLSAGGQSLALSFYTENEEYTASLKEIFPVLEEGLQKMGYASVSVAGLTRPGIRDCSDISPGGKYLASYILDLEV